MAESSRDEIAKLEALYANNPEGRVFTHLAEAYRKAGELDRARTILDNGLTRHAAYASAHVVLGRVLMDQKKSEEATEAFGRVLALDPHNMVALRSLGDLARTAGRNAEALGYFEELRHLDPSSDDLGQIIEELSAPVAPPPPVAAEEPAPVAAQEPPPEMVNIPPVQEPEGQTDADLDLGWMEDPAGHDQPLPGDLAGFASLATAGESDALFAGDATDPLGDVAFDVSFGADQPESVDDPFSSEVLSFGEATDAVPADTMETAPWDSPLESNDPLAAELFLDEPVEDDIASEGPLFLAVTGGEPSAGAPAFESSLTDEPFANESVTDEPPLEDSDATGEVVTETIAELYRSQQLYDRAADVYRALLLQRPNDDALRARLEEVETLLRTGAPDAEPAGVESAPWIGGATAAPANPPSPYDWTEQNDAHGDETPPIAAYFQNLLAWRPSAPVQPAEISLSAVDTVRPEDEEEPYILLEEDVVGSDSFYTQDEDELADDPFAGQPPPPDDPWMAAPADLAPAPATPAPEQETMPWDVPAPADPVEPQQAIAPPELARAEAPAPAIAVPPAGEAAARRSPLAPQAVPSEGDSSTPEGAFDEWFGPPAAAENPSPAPEGAAAEETPGDDDDDLEMFRSWLQSLKK